MCWRQSPQEYWVCKVLEVDPARVRPIKLCPYYDGAPWMHQTFQCSVTRISPVEGFEPTLGPVFTNPPPDRPPVERPAYAVRPKRRRYEKYYREPVLAGPVEIGREYLWGKGTRYESVLRVTHFETRNGVIWICTDDLTSGVRIGNPEKTFRDSCIPFERP
jgi:hypothetical protein